MLKLLTTRKLGGNSIPPHLTVLSVSWLNKQFKAIAVHHGVVEGTWERPGDVESGEDFEALIREAVQKTGYRGSKVSLLLAHVRLVQQLVDVPPAKGVHLKKVIERQAQLQKTFPGEAVWAYQPSLSGKTAQRVILHLFPKQLLDQLVQACKRNDLDLTSVIPASAVLHQQLTQLPLEKTDIALLAAETGGATTVVVGRTDGQILLVRTLPANWNDGGDRLALDLNRTNAFIVQQYSLTINRGAWLFGSSGAERMAALQRQIEIPVARSPVDYEPFYWATEAVKLRPQTSPNLIGRELQQAPQRRVFAKVVATITVLFVLISLAASAFFYHLAGQESASIKQLRQRIAQMQGQSQELQQRNDELARKEQIVKITISDQLPPVPGWFLGYLSEAVPAELVVTNLHVKREADLWKLQLAGTIQSTNRPPTPEAFAGSVALLTERLARGPFHVTIRGNGDKETATGKNAGGNPAANNAFLIEGVMR